MLNFLGLNSLDHCPASPYVVSEARSSLRHLKNVSGVLAGSLDETIINIKKQFHPLVLRKGLASIYADVLFEHGMKVMKTIALHGRNYYLSFAHDLDEQFITPRL